MDVGLPLECTLAELIPQLVRLADAGQNGNNIGWALSRIGEAPFAPGLTVAAASLRDGEVLYLNTRARYETPLLFDDVVDAIASAAETRRGAWRPKVGRRLGFAAAGALFVGAALLVLAAWGGQPAVAVGTGVFAVALLLSGGAFARAYGDMGAASACAGAGVFAALLAGFTALPPHYAWSFSASSLGVGLGAVTLYAAVASVLIFRSLAWFAAIAVAAGFGALLAAIVLLFSVSAVAVASVAVAVVTAIAAAAPMIALRLARLPLPSVPADMEAFRENDQPMLDADVLDQTSAASKILTGLVSALGTVAAGCCLVILGDGSFWASLLVGLVGIAWMLRSRSYAGAVQRVSLVMVGMVILASLGIQLTSTMASAWLAFVAVAVACAGAGSLFYATRVTRNAHSPFRARWLDVLEYVVLISLIPTAAAVVGVYNALRDAVS
jgi:type VII secretion integral membrane protein EccD